MDLGHISIRTCRLLLLSAVAFVSACGQSSNPSSTVDAASAESPAGIRFDLVILNGRVIDPETELDDIRNIGITDGVISAVSREMISGARTIDASDKIVSPGFIDLHSHGVNLGAYRMQAVQGVTTALELESGVLPVDDFYVDQATKRLPIHYGTSAAWTFGRIATFTGREPEASAAYFQNAQSETSWKENLATPDELEEILAKVETGLQQGALGIGVNAGYAPGYGHLEYYKLAQLAQRYSVGTYTHVRYMKGPERDNTFEAFQELIANAAATGANMHICHINSSSQKDIYNTLDLFENARANGVPVTAGAYPWGAASTVINAAMFTGPTWKENLQTTEQSFQLGRERLTKEKFDDLQANAPGTFIVWHFLDESKPEDLALIDASILHPNTLIESDAMPMFVPDGDAVIPYEGDAWPLPDNIINHPRSAATFTKILQDYVRDRGLMDLSVAIKKMSLMPAQAIEGFVPQMRKKGRIQVGMDADILVFDLDAVKVNATYSAPHLPSQGMTYVLVMGTPVVMDGELLLGAAPGQPIRRPVSN